MEDADFEKDYRKERLIDFGDNNKIKIAVSDPYGFWTIRYERGEVPEVLSGQFTTFDEAMKAVTVYLQNRKPSQRKEIKQVIA